MSRPSPARPTRPACGYEAGEYRLGQLGRFLDEIKRRRIDEIVMVGALPRPSFGSLAPELSTLKYLPHFARAFQGGDDHLLRGVVTFFEGQGLRVLGPVDIAPDLVAPVGALGRHKPSAVAREAIATGFNLLAALSPFDMGQAAIVADHRVVAVEAAEGTDAMIERVAGLVRPAASSSARATACSSRHPSSARTSGSTCPRSARTRWRAWRRPVSPASRSRPAAS